jgi:hypothetical protein
MSDAAYALILTGALIVAINAAAEIAARFLERRSQRPPAPCRRRFPGPGGAAEYVFCKQARDAWFDDHPGVPRDRDPFSGMPMRPAPMQKRPAGAKAE